MTEKGEKKIAVSVILPARDGDAELLGRAVESVKKQSMPDWELILVDDGSGERMARELDVLAASDDRIRVIHREAAGVSAARNEGIRRARGEVITFLDADDLLLPGCMAAAGELLRDSGADALWGGTVFLDAQGMKEIALRQSEDRERVICSGDCVELLPERRHKTRAECIGEPYRFGDEGGYINRGIAARFIRREAMTGAGLFFPEGVKMYEDTIWNLEMADRLRVRYVPEIWYAYYDNSRSASNRFYEEGAARIEQPLLRIRGMLDLTDPEEYRAYTRFLMDSLRYVYAGFYGHETWRPDRGQRKAVRRHLYGDEPWKEIGTGRYRAAATPRDRGKAVLYRARLLFAYWSLKKRA